MQILVVTPIQEEVDSLRQSFINQGIQAETTIIGKLPVTRFPELGITLAAGGLGKTQFAVQTQHLIDLGPGWDLVICAGAAVALDDRLAVGDIVIATETVEHDIRNKFGKPLLPRFTSNEAIIASLRRKFPTPNSLQLLFGPVASGDEDVVDPERRQEIQNRTGALVVAWEGAGGARACQFSRVPYLEIRGATDGASGTAAADFAMNLESVMQKVALLITSWVRHLHGCGNAGYWLTAVLREEPQ
jgi:adenosylhomocysteine nucleosidase